MKGTLGLYAFGMLAAALAAAFPSVTWISLVAFLLLLPLGAIWLLRAQGRRFDDFGLSLFGGWPRYLAIGMLVGLGVPVLFLMVQHVAGLRGLSPRDIHVLGTTALLLQVFVRMSLVVAVEEFLFRGFFLNALRQYFGIWVAIVGSSLLWGASHLGSFVGEGLSIGETVVGLASFLAWGATLSLCYLIARNSLWLPFGVHLGVNLGFSLAGSFFIAHATGPQWLIGHPSWSPESGLVGPLFWLIFALVAYWLARPVGAPLSADA